MHTSGICTLCPVPGPRAEENGTLWWGWCSHWHGGLRSPWGVLRVVRPRDIAAEDVQVAPVDRKGQGRRLHSQSLPPALKQPRVKLCVPNSVLTWVFPICLRGGVSGPPSETDSILAVCYSSFLLCCQVHILLQGAAFNIWTLSFWSFLFVGILDNNISQCKTKVSSASKGRGRTALCHFLSQGRFSYSMCWAGLVTHLSYQLLHKTFRRTAVCKTSVSELTGRTKVDQQDERNGLCLFAVIIKAEKLLSGWSSHCLR